MSEPTLQDIANMRNGDIVSVSQFLPFLLNLAEAEIKMRPYHEERIKRWEDFKAKVAANKYARTWMSDGLGI